MRILKSEENDDLVWVFLANGKMCGNEKFIKPPVIFIRSQLQTFGSEFKNTSPSKQPTAKLKIIFRDLDSAA